MDRGVEAIEQQTRQIRRRFLATWLALAILTLMVSLLAFLVQRTNIQASENAEDIAHQANALATSAKKQSADTVAYLRGEQGIPGVPGANGEDGQPGLPGSTGKGEKGDTGATGPAGPAGPTGETGATGLAGVAGTTGAVGASGATGLAGAAGPLGPIGSTGASGEVGATGATGEAGEAGAVGPVGPKGEQGSKGDTGDTGPAGAVGPVGPAGPAGAAGTINPVVAVGSSPNDTTPTKSIVVTCTNGGKATGGGYAIIPNSPDIVPTHTGPVNNNGWSVTVAAQPTFVEPWQVLVFAICV